MVAVDGEDVSIGPLIEYIDGGVLLRVVSEEVELVYLPRSVAHPFSDIPRMCDKIDFLLLELIERLHQP